VFLILAPNLSRRYAWQFIIKVFICLLCSKPLTIRQNTHTHTQTQEFLARDGVTKRNFCENALGGVNGNSLSRFLAGKKQDQCGNICYPAAYVFFEKLRILEGKPKTKKRLQNEAEHPSGFSLVKERKHRYWMAVANF
jgi:hypothetical protein